VLARTRDRPPPSQLALVRRTFHEHVIDRPTALTREHHAHKFTYIIHGYRDVPGPSVTTSSAPEPLKLESRADKLAKPVWVYPSEGERHAVPRWSVTTTRHDETLRRRVITGDARSSATRENHTHPEPEAAHAERAI
jgi:hypothetical protein